MSGYSFERFLGFGWWGSVDRKVDIDDVKLMKYERMNSNVTQMDYNGILYLNLVMKEFLRKDTRQWREGLLTMLRLTFQKVEHECGLLSKALMVCMQCKKITHGSKDMTHRRSQVEPNKHLQNFSLGLSLALEHSSESSNDSGLSVTKLWATDAQAWPIVGGESLDGAILFDRS